ncbi:hypothetical protein ARMSODRAFT_727433 [Armillaria solidipes]|uniref:SNTX MACPF/CDC-like domain-containing protein n=1 Tax=Armillaria solidipes TaxID=1076256 RepID=A0A2H3BBM5_9AGAR|nr:hypothetical protein ARMSODRAFT_727433 [Armillaria solidipes]
MANRSQSIQVCVAISIADCSSIPVTGSEHCTTSTDKLPIVMDDKSGEFITTQALSRSCVLGQLYDARSNNILPGFRLFHEKDIVPTKVDVRKSAIDYKEIRNTRDRAHSLNISASLEVSILGGSITIGGMGSYLNSTSETSESTTVACVAQYLTRTESLDVNSLRQLQAMTQTELAKLRATHVVVSIAYGGSVVGSLTQKSDSSTSTTDIKGKFTLEIFKGMGKMFGASGSAELSLEGKEKLNSYNLDVNLVADFSMADEDVPTTAPEILAVFRKSGKLVGDGVPIEITLAPLSIFQDGIPTFRELAEADLLEITELYDRVVMLGNNRAWLAAETDNKRDLFPTFLANCRLRNLEVSRLVQKARGELREYLEAYRAAHVDVKKPSEFRDQVEKSFTDEIELWDQDLAAWRDLVQRLRAAQMHCFPLVSINDLSTRMNRSDKGYIAAILIPELVSFANLLNTYRVLADDIRTWRTTLDKRATQYNQNSPASEKTDFVSVYADSQLDTALLQLDDRTKSLAKALEAARRNSEPVFLTYGLSADNLAQLEWSILNEDGWGIIVNRVENWRYIGGVHKGLSHGSGVVTYADKTKYSGAWINGKRDGRGELLNAEGSVQESGVYVNNLLAPDGVLVIITVYKNRVPIQHGEAALRASDSVRAHVDKIGKVMGWKIGQKYRLYVQSGASSPVNSSVRVNGSMIDPEEDPEVSFSSWSLDTNNKNVVKAHVV